MDRFFKLKENRTNAKTEILAGITTFMTMAYMIALNPNLLTDFGRNGGQALWNGVFMATCVASAIGMFAMAFLANKPFCLAPGMGLNSFFAFVVSNLAAMAGVSYLESYQAALCIILIEGVLFCILSILSVREKIVDAIPEGIRNGIAPAIGIMLMNIGLGSNAGVNVTNAEGETESYYVLRDFFGSLTPSVVQDKLGDAYPQMVLAVVTMFVGLFIMIVLDIKKVKGNVLIGMIGASGVYWACQVLFMGENPFASLKAASFIPPVADMMETTFFKFDFKTFINIGWFNVITLVVTFCIIDMFDTIGTFVGAATRSGMLDENGKMPRMREALFSDALATVAGACTGTSTVTTLAESTAGIEAGGRTGLTSLTTGLLYLACVFIAPVAAIIPAPATSAALIYVGILMFSGLKSIDINDIEQVIPVALMLIAMPVSGSIGHAIGIAMIAYTVIKVFTGKAKEVSLLTYLISLLFLVKFFLVV